MKRMEEMILKEGKILPGGVLRVGSFLNQQVDTGFLAEIGQEIGRLFRASGATKILTVEASGIAVAVAAGMAMGLPVVFAKKSKSASAGGDVYTSLVYSFTHKTEHHIFVDKEYISPEDVVLVVDDFLAHGTALNALIAIAEDAGAKVAGCAVAIEKGYQNGGDNLRARGYRIESLAIIQEMDETGITFRE